jgi:RHS repeat-associated protein
MPPRRHTLCERLEAVTLVFLTLSWGACVSDTPLAPYPGLPDSARAQLVAVPGGVVNTKGGNLLLSRLDLSLDTPLGSQEIRAVYNSTSGDWLWSFQMRYDGSRFVEPSGAVYDPFSPESGVLTQNGTLPGTHWVRVDANTLKTKGGLAYHFDALGALDYISWATLDYPRISFTPQRISQCLLATTCTPLFDLSLNGSGDPLQVTDARTGRTASFSYDVLGRLESARSPADVDLGRPGTRYEYETLGTLLTSTVNSEGERVEYEYQAGRRILHVTQIGEGNPRHRFEFYGKDPELQRWTTVHTNPVGGETRYLYNGVLREVERSQSGEVTAFSYAGGTIPAALRPASITTPGGARTSFSISGDDDVTQIVEASGNVVSVTHEPGAVVPSIPLERPPKRIEDSVGLLSETSYGGDGRPVRLDLPENESASAVWQGAIRTELRGPFGTTTIFNSYGIHGHWIDATVPSTYFPVRRAFDPVGNPLVSAAGLQDGGVLDRSYDADRQVRQIHVAATEAGQVTSEASVTITRRSDGQPLSVQRPLGADHEFVYDAIGRLEILREQVDGVWQDTSFEYDAAGNVSARVRPNGMREELGYDAYGRLTRRAALRDGVLEGEGLLSWAGGLPVSYWDSKRGVTEVYGYDAAERLTGIAYSSGESAALRYDVRSRVTEVTYAVPGLPDHRVAYAYDGADRQTRVGVDGETLAELSYANGRQVRVEYGNGLVRDTLHDPTSGRIAGFHTRDAAQALVASTSIARTVDSERFLTSAVTTTPLGTTRESYSMGLAGLLGDPDRRVGNRVWGWDDGEAGSKAYVYDELSNPISNADGDTFVYNPERNRLLGATLAHEAEIVSYAYDEAGFVISRNGTPLSWTATGRLAAYGPVSIEWDMADRPISTTIAGQTRSFGLFGGSVDADPLTGGIAGLDLGVVKVSFSSGDRLYRHRDFRGNVGFVSDEAGAVVAHYRYSAYAVDAVLGADSDGQRFAGRLDAGDGLVLMGARIYDQLTGRFLSQDPIFQSLNQYSYTLGNPIDFWDPDGAHPQTVAEAEAAVFEAEVDLALVTAATTIALAAIVVNPVNPLVLVSFAGAFAALANQIRRVGQADRALREARRRGRTTAPGADLPGLDGSGLGGGLESLDSFGGRSCSSRCGPGSGPPPPPSWPEGVNSGCAPASLALGVPGTSGFPWVLGVLIPLQLSLGLVMLRQRGKRRR